MTSWQVVAATGHRPDDLSPAQRAWLRVELRGLAVRLRDEYDTRVGISGMALGVDTLWAHAVLAAGLDLWAYVPFPQQPDRWSRTAQAEYHELLGRAAWVKVIADRPSFDAYGDRNVAMMREAAAAVAGWRQSKSSGGTFHALNAAVELDRPIVWLDVDRQRVVRPTQARWRELLGMPQPLL